MLCTPRALLFRIEHKSYSIRSLYSYIPPAYSGVMITPTLIWALVTISAFATSVLSGIVGMAGGMVLLVILISLLPVSSAMVLHAATQFTANGSRALLLRKHILWALLPL